MLATIPTLRPADFDRRAVEIERTPAWRYGYVNQYHGAMLVKSPSTPAAPPFVALPLDDEIAAILTPEIRRRRPKAWAELALYLALFAYVRIISVLRTAHWPMPSRKRALSGGLAAVGFVTLALAPYLVAGYGEPLFSTRTGPGARISSALLPTTGPIDPAITYTALVQQIVALPLFTAIPVVQWFEGRLSLRATLWLLSAVSWSLIVWSVSTIGLVFRWGRQAWQRRASQRL